jgi:hypothetical protein
MSKSVLALALLALAVAASQSHAAVEFKSPNSWTRGAGGTTYQHWSFFNDYPTDSIPDLGNINPNGTASITETTGMGLVTGGGNIYTPGAAANFVVTIPEQDVPAPPHDITALVQIRTLGTLLDLNSVKLNTLAPVKYFELFSTPSPMGGANVEHWYLFNVPYASFGDGFGPDTEDLTLNFTATGIHMSLDEISIDTAIRPFGFYAEQVPEPSMALLTLVSLAGAGLWRRK